MPSRKLLKSGYFQSLSAEQHIADRQISAASQSAFGGSPPIRDRCVAPKIRNFILAAPDVDMDLARTAFRDIDKDRLRLTPTVSGDDPALARSPAGEVLESVTVRR